MTLILPEYPLKPNGYFEILNADGSKTEGETMQCCHCGKHWIVRPRSKRKRGWCLKCSKSTCGGPRCDECLPIERGIEIIEARKRECH